MNKLKFIYLIFLASGFLKGQFLAVYTPTILPSNPIYTNQIKVITKVKTPNLGYKLNSYVNYDFNNWKINFEVCYWDGMLPASKTHIDTINVGLLFPGTYQFNFKFYLSGNNTNCVPFDSAKYNIQIAINPNSIQDYEANSEPMIYPNPAHHLLTIKSAIESKYVIYNTFGQIIASSIDPKLENRIDLSDFTKGLYFIDIITTKYRFKRKFIKT